MRSSVPLIETQPACSSNASARPVEVRLNPVRDGATPVWGRCRRASDRKDLPKNMKLDAIRFSIGPWNGRYSSVWRVWSRSDDVYLGVRTLLKYMKISLHQSGRFRVAFTESYNRKMVTDDGKSCTIDRAFLKWDKLPTSQKEIMQALDIHFALSALSL